MSIVAEIGRLLIEAEIDHLKEPLATEKQVGFLQVLRRRAGLERWRQAKRQFGIARAGTHELSRAEASRLIDFLKRELDFLK